LFFCICFSLGYPSLNRFDPRLVTPDAEDYFRLVTGRPSEAGDLLRYRVLVPWVAKPFYWMSRGHIRSWNPIAFGMLVSNSLFTATGACLLLSLGRRIAGSEGTALAGTLLYLLNFTMSNRQLGTGLVESGQACGMLALFQFLSTQRFRLLPFVGIAGALTKESSIPLSAMAAAGWLFMERHNPRWRESGTTWLAIMVVAGLSTFSLIQFSIDGRFTWLWQFVVSLRDNNVSLLQGLINCVTDRYFWYVFGWLLPLGLLRLKDFPASWIVASVSGAAAALAMGAWGNTEGNTVPAIFNSVGPILSLSTAQFLTKRAGA